MIARLMIVAALLGGAIAPVLAEPPAPVVGGWSAIAHPAANGAVRGAARAAMARIPDRHARLKAIDAAESQVVAGINYRLVLRLADRTRWRATVWHKLDGEFAVSAVARMPRSER